MFLGERKRLGRARKREIWVLQEQICLQDCGLGENLTLSCNACGSHELQRKGAVTCLLWIIDLVAMGSCPTRKERGRTRTPS